MGCSVELLRVLVVDDERELVDALVERLNMRGVQATGVTTGAEALRCMKEAEHDVVLLDVKMPSPGGLDVLREIKRQWPERQVVLLTGHGSALDAQLGMQLGAFDYVMKPVDIEALMAILLKAGEQAGGAD
jgi:DNA-binding NtrC family response regulator